METNSPVPEKKVKFSDNEEFKKAVKIEYLTGKYTLFDLSEKYKIALPIIYRVSKVELWREEMERFQIPIPKEPRPGFIPFSQETWTKVEADYMRGDSTKAIADRYDMCLATVQYRAKKYKWAFYRAQIEEAKQRKNVGLTLANKMAEFDEVSCNFIEAATEQVRKMSEEIRKSKDLKPENLEKMIKLHAGLYESIKKLPVAKQAQVNDKSIHPALRPAPILKIG